MTDVGFLDWLLRRERQLDRQLAVSERVREAADEAIRREVERQRLRRMDPAEAIRRARRLREER